MPSPLSKLQKRELSQLSDRAFEAVATAARERGEDPPMDWKARAEFRHAEVAKAVSKAGLRCCSQADYASVKAHFLHLAGRDGEAMTWHMRAQTEPRRQAETVLFREVQAAAAAGITPKYVEAICCTQYRCCIAEASANQLWKLVYTVRNRAAAKRKGHTT